MLSLGFRRGVASLLALSPALSCAGGQGYDDGNHPVTLGDQAQGNASASNVGSAEIERAIVSASEVSNIDEEGGALRVIEVPNAGSGPRLVQTPLGWLALSSRSVGDARVPSGYENVLYQSTNGVDWESVPFNLDSADVELSALAYGNGTHVMLGRRQGGIGVVWVSQDAQSWTETEQPVGDSVFNWGTLVFSGEYFFAMGFTLLGISADGTSWTTRTTDLVQPTGAAYGNGRYVMAGSGPMLVSDDPLAWTSVDVDCALPGACLSDPDGNVHQSSEHAIVFAAGRFYTDQLSSTDGTDWRAEPDVFPVAYVGGRLLGDLAGSPWSAPAWQTSGEVDLLRVVRPSRAAVSAETRGNIGRLDRDAELPEAVSVPFDDGLDCQSAECLLVGQRLLLVPPPDTAPLADKVPRDVDGAPLLSDDCPVSSMLFCDDYEQRIGCVCNPEAPRNPSDCQDVSEYQCEGELQHAEDEWDVDEIREAGCDCLGTDPNQPASFGLDCSEENVCDAALECLPIDAPTSIGPPPPQPFMCTATCEVDSDCPSWEASGFCAGEVSLRCSNGSCQPRQCE